MNYMLSIKNTEPIKIVTKTGYTRYRKAIEDGKISEIIKQPGNIQDKYDIWTK